MGKNRASNGEIEKMVLLSSCGDLRSYGNTGVEEELS